MAFVKGMEKEILSLDQVLVVREFPYVFNYLDYPLIRI